MTCTPGPAALTLPGAFKDLPLDTQDVTASTHYRLTEYGQLPEAGLIIGESQQNGNVLLKCQDPRYWQRIEAQARECARFLEDAQRVQGRAA